MTMDAFGIPTPPVPPKVNVDSVSKSEGEALKALKALMPDPLPVPAIPAQSIIAWQQSADIKAVMSLVAQAPQFAQSMSQLETALKQFEVDLHNDLLKTIGTTYALWAGAGKDPISALTLLATAFVGLDIAGGDPQAFVDTVKKLIEKSGAPVPMLTGVPNGFDLSHEMGKLEIRADNASKRLSFRFGKVPTETLAKTRPKAKSIGLTKDQQSAGWLDFQALATAVKVGAGLAGASPIGALAGKAATAVAQYDYLIVTGGMKGPYQTGHGELVMKAAAPSK